ncbi:hypothetical protein G9A89_004681, partial [Geosiphon pyriformis]
KQHSKNNFKVVTTPDATTLEYYQSIYTHCKQRFNIPDGIEVVKKSVYQYIENRINNYLFGNYNILEVRSNLYNNLVYYSQLETEDLNSETLATYFQELNFNIIKYCEETYPVQSQYSIDFESETETSNKGKQKLKQYSKTTPNTPILPKTTAKHLQTSEQRTTVNEENDSKISEEESIDSENEEDKMTAYIAKIPKFNEEDIETSPQEWLDQVTKAGDANGWNAARMLRTIPYFLKETAEPSESVMTYIGKFNKLLRQICQLENNDYYSDAQILDQFIAGLKDKLIKKVHPHVPEDLNFAIQHAKRYKMAIEEANCTKLVNLAIGKTSSAAEKKINQLTKKVENYFTNQQQQQPQRYQLPKDRIKTTSYHPLITSLRIAITVESLATKKEIAESYNKTNKTGVINVTLHHNNLITNHHYHQLTIHQDRNIKLTTINLLYSQCNNSIDNPFNITKYLLEDWFNKTNLYHKTDFNAAANEQKAITAMYTETEVEGKAICLILDNGSKTSVFKFEEEEEKPVVKTFMVLESTSNWAEETEQTYFATNSYSEEPETSGWNIPYSKPEP